MSYNPAYASPDMNTNAAYSTSNTTTTPYDANTTTTTTTNTTAPGSVDPYVAGSAAMPAGHPYTTGSTTMPTQQQTYAADGTGMPMQQTTATTTTATTYDAPAPNLPPRPVVLASNNPDIQTSYVGQPLSGTGSFTTNTGALSQPVSADGSGQLVRPASGILHSIKKAMTTGSSGPPDPLLDHADATLRTNVSNTRHLQQQLLRYHQAQQALQDATVAVASSFHAVLSDEMNPYASTSAQLLQLSQQHSLTPPTSNALIDQANAAANDMENGYASIRNDLTARRAKASDVDYYVAKVDKLTNEQEQAIANGKADPKQRERLDRNIGKTREAQLEYNAENERLIQEVNALWRRRILQLGPAFTSFIAQQQLVYADHAAFYARMASTTQQINTDYAHNNYLQSQSTLLVPPGSGYVDHRELIDRSREMGTRSDVVQHQRQLEAETQRRVDTVQNQGGHLETVAQETIVRSEERMRVTKERWVSERVRLRKVITTEMVTITVPVRKERLEIDRTPVNGPITQVTEAESLAETDARNQRRSSRGTPSASNTDDEVETYELVVSEERPRVINDIVPIERVRLRKLRSLRSENLEMDVRREHIDFQAPTGGQPGQETVVTRLGSLQTVVGQKNEGFTDRTGNANVVVVQVPSRAGGMQETVQDGVVQQSLVQGEYRKANIDDQTAMSSMGVQQRGDYDTTTGLQQRDQYDPTMTDMTEQMNNMSVQQQRQQRGPYDTTTTTPPPQVV